MPEGGTGATPGTGAKPDQSTDDDSAEDKKAAAQPPATGEDALGDAGKAVLRQARSEAKEAKERADALQKQINDLQAGSETEHEKAIAAARREAAAERDAHWTTRLREAEVRGALRGAGLANDKTLALAVGAPEFHNLKVDPNTGAVEGIAEAIESFKKDYPEVFPKAPEEPTEQPPKPPQNAWDGAQGTAGSQPPKAKTLEEAVAQGINAQFQKPT